MTHEIFTLSLLFAVGALIFWWLWTWSRTGSVRGDLTSDIDLNEPPNLHDADVCYFCRHAHDTDWQDGMHCRKFDDWILIYETCDGFEKEE